MQLQPHAIGGEAAAAQAGPDDRVLRRHDTLRMIFHYAANSLKNPVEFIAFAAFYTIVFTSITWNFLLVRPGRCKIPAPEDQRFFGAFFFKRNRLLASRRRSTGEFPEIRARGCSGDEGAQIGVLPAFRADEGADRGEEFVGVWDLTVGEAVIVAGAERVHHPDVAHGQRERGSLRESPV
jgi:hypothetical protein